MEGGCMMVEGSTARNDVLQETCAPQRRLHIVERGAEPQGDSTAQVLPAVAHARLHAKGAGSEHSCILSCAAAALVLVLALGGATVLARRDASATAAMDSVEMTEVLVQPGDSLWGLAEEHGIEGVSTAQTVELILAWNGLESSTIQAGTVLAVPDSD